MNPVALLALLADLYAQVQALQEEVQRLRADLKEAGRASED